jgi:type IV pilus assembly protein PilF
MNRVLHRVFGVAVTSVAAIVLAACAGSAPRPQPPEAEAPVSQQQVGAGDPVQRAKVHTELGALYLADGRLATALEEARTAAEANPDYAPAYSLLGLIHMYLHENPQAEENFERALRLAPGDAEINNNFGWFLCQTSRERRSIGYFQTAIKNPLYATPIKPLTNAGICSLRMGDDKAAEEFLTRALRIENDNATALYWLADVLYRTGRIGEARLRIQDLHHQVEPDAASAWLALRIDRKFGDREGEARYAGVLRRKFADTPEYQKYLQGQYE